MKKTLFDPQSNCAQNKNLQSLKTCTFGFENETVQHVRRNHPFDRSIIAVCLVKITFVLRKWPSSCEEGFGGEPIMESMSWLRWIHPNEF